MCRGQFHQDPLRPVFAANAVPLDFYKETIAAKDREEPAQRRFRPGGTGAPPRRQHGTFLVASQGEETWGNLGQLRPAHPAFAFRGAQLGGRDQPGQRPVAVPRRHQQRNHRVVLHREFHAHDRAQAGFPSGRVQPDGPVETVAVAQREGRELPTRRLGRELLG